ncbi:MAG: lysophospholipid acyltransferase family protein [Acidobacteria bacterium]|nr:lysophospholipid acyltransferase family protein [Acidobacteriota bacterium]MBI3657198.1 lysophospholipid acyltransferase family protein [Acidobacteriota bacterium]
MRHWNQWLTYVVAETLIRGLRLLPRAVALRITRSAARAAYYIDRYHRRIMMDNLCTAFPEWTNAQRDRVCRQSFLNLGQLLTEVCRLPRLNKDNIGKLVRYDQVYGRENFQKAYAEGRGVLFLTGHFSSWELMPFAQALYGYPLKFVVRPLDNPYLDAKLTQYRRLSGNTPIGKRNALRALLQSLRRGEAVGLLIDQAVQAHEGVWTNFFGRPACTTHAPALLALRTGAAVIPAHLVRNEDDTYRMVFYKELELVRTGRREQDILVNTQRFTQAIESMICQYPDQWLWGHRRWKTQPPQE